jgi:uncharacterized protein
MINQSQNYLNASHQGENQWWRYSIGILLTLFFYLGLGSIAALVIFLINTQLPGTELSNSVLLTKKFEAFLKIPSLPAYTAVNMNSLFGAIGLLITVVFIHQRKVTSLVRTDRVIRWRRIFAGFLVWWVIGCLFSGIDYLLNPKNYVLSFTQNWFFCLPLALILTPIQTSFEELLYRGYLMQGMALILRNRIALVMINGILFMLPHLANPELQRGGILAIYYFIFGAALAALTIRDNGLELSLGIHAANNLLVLIFNTKDSALPVPSIWQVQTHNPPIVDIALTVLMFTIVYYIFFGRSNTKSGSNTP